MPSCLSELLAHNAAHNITMTPSEINKTVRRMNKLRAKQEAERSRLTYMDDTGEIACGFKESPFSTSHANAARRVSRQGARA